MREGVGGREVGGDKQEKQGSSRIWREQLGVEGSLAERKRLYTCAAEEAKIFFPHKTSKRRERKVEWFRGCCLALKEVEKARQGAAVCASGLLALQLSERRRRRRRRRRIGQMDWSLAGSVPPA